MKILKQNVRNSLTDKTIKNSSQISAQNLFKMLTVLVTSSMIVACSDSDNDTSVANAVTYVDYEVEIVNLTHNQPLSPLALRGDDATYKAWTVGESATVGLEYIAEAGDNSVFLATTSTDKSTSGAGVIGPGETAVIDLQTPDSDRYFTAVTMLVNTNDAFAGVTGLNLSSLAIGDETVVFLPIYDAGTEGNDELAGTIPGPADGGVGYDAARNDVDFVARHPGVVSVDDGYPESVLDGSHKFDGAAARLKITRIN